MVPPSTETRLSVLFQTARPFASTVAKSSPPISVARLRSACSGLINEEATFAPITVPRLAAAKLKRQVSGKPVHEWPETHALHDPTNHDSEAH